MEQESLPITCPICGRKNLFPVGELVEGSIFACPVCKVKLTLHGHMWEEIRADIEKLKSR
jgi:rubrerythrin